MTTIRVKRNPFGVSHPQARRIKAGHLVIARWGYAVKTTVVSRRDLINLRVHAVCVMSNHYHIVATDVHGNLPEFMHWLNEYTAKCVNAHLGR